MLIMNSIFHFFKIALILGSVNCQKVNENDISEGSREGDNDMNDIMYSHEDIDESVDSDGNSTTIYDDSYEASTNSSDTGNSTTDTATRTTSSTEIAMNDTTTTEVITCQYTDNITMDNSDESQSTLINFPYSVSIQRKGAHYASGALVGKRWILSSAGEFYNVRESIKLFRARLGSVDCKRGGTLVPLKEITIHPSYTYKKPNFDIALLRMAVPVQYSDYIRPISLSNKKGTVVSAKFMTTYWPRIVVSNVVLPESAKERIKYNSMRVSTQRLIPADKCLPMMRTYNETLEQSSLCLKPVVTHHSVCMPDVGAPVIAEDGLWGITSGWVAPTCPLNPGPTLSTRISSNFVRSWLDAQLLDL